MSLEEIPADHGHFFTKKSFHKPTYCHQCTDLLWGFIGQGLVCKVCNYTIHEKCAKVVCTPCTSYLADHIKNPSAHCWSNVGHFKKKFCNVCRRKLEESPALRCEVCEYYVHVDCRDFVVSDCEQCATYTPHVNVNTAVHFHHWREGNLPRDSKCVVCRKTCWSGECLTGFRCEWCGTTVHASCRQGLAVECSFGSLRSIILPPYCVTVPRLNFSIETILSFTKSSGPSRTTSEEWSSTESGKNGEEATSSSHCSLTSEKPAKSPKEPKEKDEIDTIHVYDGDQAYKNGMFRVVYTSRNAPALTALEETLRVLYMPMEPSKFYLCLVREDGAEGIRLDERYPIKDQITVASGEQSLLFYLRMKEKERGSINIYIDSLLPLQKRPRSNCEDIPVNKDTTAGQCMAQALEKFGLQDEIISNFIMTTVLVDKGIIDKSLSSDERPFELIQKIGRMKEDPHGSSIALFVGNLPVDLSQRQYDKILTDIIGPDLRWSTIDVIYYEYGSLVITYNSPDKATKAFSTLQNSSFDDKTLYVMLLPNIQAHMIPSNVEPLLVFVNAKSGGCQGQQLITWFRKTLNPHQVFDLSNGGPLPGLYVFRNVKKYRLLLCGGDGTVGWALQCLDNVSQDAVFDSPPIAIIPLGTGNDLARVLRWGPGFTGAEDLMNLLHDVIDAEDVQLDRWTVIFHPEVKETDEMKAALMQNDAHVADTNEDTTQMFVMNNYMGFGIDAELSLDFHNARQKNPDKFSSRLHNKGVYIKMSLRKMANRTPRLINQQVKVEVDGKVIDLPQIEGIIILNILSWASGANPWGPEKDDKFTIPNHWDGMLEVVGVTGVMHMGKIQGGIGNAMRLAQGGHIRITMDAPIPIHIDGEPWVQPKGQCVIIKSALKATMLQKSKHKFKRRNTEPSIFFSDQIGAQASPTTSPS